MNTDLKEEYRIFFLVKGHLDATESTVLSSYDGYFKRLWYDGANGAPLYEKEEEFEKEWKKRTS